MSTYSPIYKVIIVWEGWVDKTCLLSMYIKGVYGPTITIIEVEFFTKKIELNNGTKNKSSTIG